MECCLWYAPSYYRVFTIVPAAKTPSSRPELRYAASTGHHGVGLSTIKHIPSVCQCSWATKSNAAFIDIWKRRACLCHSYNVAGGGRQFIPGWFDEAQVGQQFVHARSIHVQESTLMHLFLNHPTSFQEALCIC
jgi:hypothetical protein